MPTRAASDRSRVRLRVLSGSAIAIGPGKADLLAALDQTGSISAAARQMGMSYRRAWLLVRTMNDCFIDPVVEAVKGGAEGGGARLTRTGRLVLKRYEALSRESASAFAPLLRATKRRGT